jgi:outer membrane protein assembly factor BamB
MRRTVYFLVLGCFLFAGCGSVRERITNIGGDEDNSIPPAELVEFEPTLELSKLWSGRFGKGTDEQYLKLVPAALEDYLFIADRGGRMIAIEAQTGKSIWEERDKTLRISGGPGAGDGLVLAGTSDAQVIAREAATGAVQWIADVSSEVLAPPQVARGVVVVRTGDGKLFGLHAENGKRIWVYDRSIPTLTLRGTGTPVIVDDIVIAGFDSGRLTALDLLSGKPIWETRLAVPSGRSDLERMVDLDSEPVIAGDTAYVASYQASVAAVFLDDGKLQWTREISSYAGIAVDEDKVYVTDEEGFVWALDRYNGSSIWKQEALKARAVTGPTIIGDYVVVGDFDGYLHWMGSSDGEFVQRIRVDDERIIVPAIPNGDTLISYSTSGLLTALHPE